MTRWTTCVAVCIALASSPALGRKSGDPELELKPQKDALVLARDPDTTIRITLQGASPKRDAAPRVAASVGSLGELKESKPGQWEIQYKIPESKPPSVAIVIAEIETKAGVVSGATAIRLLGKARVSVKTEKNAKVHLKVAGRKEGPFQADGAGVVETSITVPPGYEEFQIFAVDKAGNRSKRKKALAVPPFPMVAIGPAPTELIADGKHPLTISVASVSNRGDLTPFRGKCRSPDGKLKKLDGDDIGRWRFDIDKTGSGATQVTCSIGGGKHRTATLELALVPGELHSLALTGPSECPAGQTCDLTIDARDVADNPIVKLPILEASTDLGAVAMAGPDDNGIATWQFTAPDTYEPDRVATVKLAGEGGRPSTEATIALTPAAVAELSFVSEGESVVVGSEIRLPVRALDAFGNPVPVEPPPTLSADVGEATWTAEGEDAPAVVYKSPERVTSETDLVRMTFADLKAEIPLVLQGRWRHSHLSARAGVLALRNGLWGPAIGVDATSSLPPLDGRFSLAIRVTGVRSQSSSNISNQTGDTVLGKVDQVLWMVPAVAGLDVTVVDAGSWGLVFGVAGGGLLMLTSLDVTARSGQENSVPPDRESVVLSPAASGHLRGTIALGPGDLEIGVDALFAWTRSAESIRGDVLAFTGSVGWRFNWEDALW